MADKSKIEWTDATWNPVTGCTPISEGCANCYAKRMAGRFGQVHGWDYIGPRGGSIVDEEVPRSFSRINFHKDRLDQPLHWKKPRRIFVCSMGDLFHEDIPGTDIARVIKVICNIRCRGHTFMILTKRPERMKAFFDEIACWIPDESPLPPNVWLGVTAENQARAEERIPILLEIPAAVRFVSIEPMLGPISIPAVCRSMNCPCWCGVHVAIVCGQESEARKQIKWPLDWIIVGGETGPYARAMHPDWVRSVRDQCITAGVPFFFKKWGGYKGPGDWEIPAGRELDGRMWEEFPNS